MKKTFCFLLLLFAMESLVLGQTKIGLESLIPPAPNAAELGKYSTMPVSTLTGIPDISFPLYEVTSGSLKLPITLSYHASGIQVNQKSTDVGLGWSVMAGGTISRTVYGASDNSTHGFFYYTAPSYDSLTNITNYYTMTQFNIVGNTGYDMEPDLFVYNAGGKSGKFIYNHTDGFVTIPFDPVKIDTVGHGSGISFKITDDNGIIYNFGVHSQTHTDAGVQRSTISSWYLSSVISPDHTDTISLEYETVNSQDEMVQQSYPIGKNATVAPECSGTQNFVLGDLQTTNIANTYDELLVKKIKFKLGYVEFFRNTARKDINTSIYQASKSLDRIIVYDGNGAIIKCITFNHDYFTVTPYTDDYIHNRLQLTGFTESGDTSSVVKQYRFGYDPTALPKYNSYQMDYWGYYNGSVNITTLIPPTTVYAEDITNISFANGENYSNGILTGYWTFGTANREPSATYMQAAVLNKVTYPSGGYSTFEYEPHKYQSDNYVTQNESAGGISYGIDKHTLQTATYNFDYPSSSGLSSVNPASIHATVNIAFSASNMSNNEFGLTQKVTLKDNNTSVETVWEHEGDLTLAYNVNELFTLVSGHSYQLKTEIYGSNAVSINAGISWTENTTEHQIKIGGGLRIRSIKHYTDSAVLAKEEYYTYGENEDGLGVKLFDEQNFYRNYEDVVNFYFEPASTGEHPGGLGACILEYQNWVRNYLGISKYNSLNYLGSPVLYSMVTKYEGTPSSNTGKTVYKYNINTDMVYLPAEFVNSGNYGSINNAWNQGQLDTVTTYKYDGTQYAKVAQTETEYAVFNQRADTAVLFKQHKQFVKLCNCFTYTSGPEPYNIHYGQGYFVLYRYNIKTGAVRPSKETRIQYDQNDISKSTSTITTYQYQNSANRYVTETSVTTSDGTGNNNTKITRLKYPQDVSGTVQTAMINKNMLTPVLEEKTYKSLSGTETLLSTIQTNYMQSGDLIVKSDIKASTGALTPETRINFNQYDANGNILEQQKTKDVKEVYLWGYHGQYPVAKILNSTDSIASGYITQSVLDNPSDDATLRSHLANLRNIPGTMVTTYTYKPLVGMTSQTDPAGRTTYYEYDSFNRLKTIRDQDGKVIKTIDYQYQQTNNQ